MHTVKGGRAYRSTGRQKPAKGLHISHQYSHVVETLIAAAPIGVFVTTRAHVWALTAAHVASLVTRTLALLRV